MGRAEQHDRAAASFLSTELPSGAATDLDAKTPRRFLLLTLDGKESCGSEIKTCNRRFYASRKLGSIQEVSGTRKARKSNRTGHPSWSLFLIGITVSVEFIRLQCRHG